MNNRIQAAVDRLRIRSTDHILEIGCGHGVAVDLMCRGLTTGQVVAIDRSAKMIAASARRNASHVKAGRAVLHVSDLASFDPGPRRFDAILALRVAAFVRDPEATLARVRRWLKPRGRLIVEYDTPAAPNTGTPSRSPRQNFG